MIQGKFKATLRLLMSKAKEYILSLNSIVQTYSEQQPIVCESLTEKHPPGQSPYSETLLYPLNSSSEPHPVLFDCLDGEMIRSAALRTEGSASHLEWTPMVVNMCTSFIKASSELCNSVALVYSEVHLYYPG